MIGRIYDDRVKQVQPVVEKFQAAAGRAGQMASGADR